MFDRDNWWTIGARYAKFGMEIDQSHTYNLHVRYCYELETLRQHEVLCLSYSVNVDKP
jgi:hypothetical protein